MRNVKFSPVFTNTVYARRSRGTDFCIFGFVAATMLPSHVLLHLLIIHLLTAKDVPPLKDIEYKIQHIDTCPAEGYYFKKEMNANFVEPGPCYLCFCQGDHTAVCWKRDKRRCNKESFHYHEVGKRIRRSPGFTDVFFRDASRDYFNNYSKAQCKPYESFSKDCPPADWCTGCTICDCDANGHWDCHLLSFCTDEKNKKQPQKRIAKKSVPIKLAMISELGKRRIRYKTKLLNKTDTKNELIIKKTIGTHRPIEMRTSKVTAEMKNLTEIVKQTVNKRNINNVDNAKRNVKKINKRQIRKPQKKLPQKMLIMQPMKKPVYALRGKTTGKPMAKRYVRNKREVEISGDTGILTNVSQGSSTESTSFNTTVALSVIPVTKNLLVPDGFNCSHTSMGNSTPPEYYKYSVGTEGPKAKAEELISDAETTQVNVTETVFKLIDRQLNSTVPAEKRHDNDNKASNIINFTEINPEENELKYSKWSDLKNLKEIKVYPESVNKQTKINKLMTNKVIFLEDKNRINGKNIERKLNSRKYNIVKVINHPKCKFNNFKINNNSNMQIATKNKGNLQGFLTNIMREINKNNTTYVPKRKKKFNVLRYLERIFNKKIKQKKTPIRLTKHQLIDTLCEKFGPCKVSRKNKVHLKVKVSELDNETTKILNTVKIVKGLLKLVELPISAINDVSKQDSFLNDKQKLNYILNGGYSKSDRVTLTATQLTQIENIKRNILDFMQSVSKFTSLLNEIITTLTKENMNRSKDVRNTNENLIKDRFQSLKNLLVRYNLVQNTFLKQMYEQLNEFESNINEKPKVNEVKDFNNSVAIENFSRNIIQNLRKLKHLAQTVSYGGRTKRDTAREDDTTEYLLMMMEYLIKQNHPLDAAPVNDGIDLLIEAIKNAPDIKPIKKKVLEYTPVPDSDIATIASPTFFTSEDNFIENNIPSDSDKSFSDNKGKIKLEDTETKFNENKELLDMIADDEKEFEDLYDRGANPDITERAFIHKADDNMVQKQKNVIKITTSMPLEMETSDKLDIHDEINVENTLEIENNNLNKQTEETKAGEKNIEVFPSGYMNEEIILPNADTIKDSNIPSTTIELVTAAKEPRIKMRRLNIKSDESESDDEIPKVTWIEENFRKIAAKEFRNIEDTTLGISAVTPKPIDKTDVSSLTEENFDDIESKRKNMAISSVEEVMYKKQMELLNSLDYGNEKELYEYDSKDHNYVEDRFTGDNFPSYLV